MIVRCTNCGSRYRLKDELLAGGPKRFKCKNCGASLLVKPPSGDGDGKREEPEKEAPRQPADTGADASEKQPTGQMQAEAAAEAEKMAGEEPSDDGGPEEGEEGLSPEEIAARQQEEVQHKLEQRRRQMEDEISGRLNKAALETLDFDVLSELANKIQEIRDNPEFHADEDTSLFSCIKCRTTFCLYPDDSRLCTNCGGEVSLVKSDDILKQFGMFG